MTWLKCEKSARVWWLQKIAGLFPVWNIDDLHTDQYCYKKPKSTDAVFAKIVLFFLNQNLQFQKHTFLINYTALLFSHDFASLFLLQRLKCEKSARVWWLQKIACLFPVWNIDDLHTDQYCYKKPKSTDAVFAKIVLFFLNQNLQFQKHTFLINYTALLFSHDFASLFLLQRDDDRFSCIWAASWQNQQNDCAPSEDSDKDPSFLHVDSEEFWSDWADAQADPSLRWAQLPLYWFCHDVAHMFDETIETNFREIMISCTLFVLYSRTDELIKLFFKSIPLSSFSTFRCKFFSYNGSVTVGHGDCQVWSESTLFAILPICIGH